MIAFIENPNLLILEFNEMANVAQNKSYISVGIEIQQEEIETLKQYREDLGELKKEFARRKLENEANLVYCITSALYALQLELQMLVNIKQDKMEQAWASLVEAQVTYGTVARNYPFELLETNGYLQRLSDYERLLFPKQFFMSSGGVIRKTRCTICGGNFNDCEHMKGKLYMGELCCREIIEMDLEEGSFVDNPANKLCRAISIDNTDLLTLRPAVKTVETGYNQVQSSEKVDNEQ